MPRTSRGPWRVPARGRRRPSDRIVPSFVAKVASRTGLPRRRAPVASGRARRRAIRRRATSAANLRARLRIAPRGCRGGSARRGWAAPRSWRSSRLRASSRTSRYRAAGPVLILRDRADQAGPGGAPERGGQPPAPSRPLHTQSRRAARSAVGLTLPRGSPSRCPPIVADAPRGPSPPGAERDRRWAAMPWDDRMCRPLRAASAESPNPARPGWVVLPIAGGFRGGHARRRTRWQRRVRRRRVSRRCC